MSKKIDGKAIAEAMLSRLSGIADGKAYTLAVLYAGSDPATLSYIKGKSAKAKKAGIQLDIISRPADIEAEAFYRDIEKLNNDSSRLPIQTILSAKKIP